MIEVAAAVENDLRDALFLSHFADNGADLSCALDGAALLARCLELGAEGRNAADGGMRHVVDNLRVDVGIAARHTKARTLRRAGNLAANATMATG